MKTKADMIGEASLILDDNLDLDQQPRIAEEFTVRISPMKKVPGKRNPFLIEFIKGKHKRGAIVDASVTGI